MDTATPGRKKSGAPILDSEALCAVLEEAVARRLGSYERRDAQLDLVRFIAGAFNHDLVAAAEAGTGVGKSFAYLLPAAEFSEKTGERVIISTATITLQTQLYNKDIPLIEEALERELNAVLVKGRGNYLCLRRLEDAVSEAGLDAEENGVLADIARWSANSGEGSFSELENPPSDEVWSRVCSEADSCMSFHCPHKTDCFFFRLRRRAEEARILVVNHHLLFADLAARMQGAGYEAQVVLPSASRIILDEAHTIEGAATAFFSDEWSRYGLQRSLGRLYRKKRTRESGLLIKAASLLPSFAKKSKSRAASVSRGVLPKKIHAALDQAREWADKAGEAALAFCGREGSGRLCPARGDTAALFPPLEALRRGLQKICVFIETLLDEAEERELQDPVVWELRAVRGRLAEIAELCLAFINYREDQNRVFWIEKSGAQIRWKASPLDLAPLLRRSLFEANATVAALSATLTPFEYWSRRTGALLADKELVTGFFPSPFPYRSRTLLAVPADAPLPGEASYQDFVNGAVRDLVSIAGGSALVLFTSYQSLSAAYEAAAPALEDAGILCLRQGAADRSRLLARFLEEKESVLFATDSFWEGVDAPGETLRMVILCRLPFRTPKDPLYEARREKLEAQGINSFTEYSLPDAVMKFKQGFGRLMRRADDYGVVVVLDRRILSMWYGQAFLRALPETKTSFGESAGMVRDVERFLFS
ncbi:MAG: ATP-dependent DNA helicase DinG [Treponema sp.]|jgi:ATP-dependent DNA helicase DinG|nr:ATP-dependent DNA helicase DinG [Treponema sp.]